MGLQVKHAGARSVQPPPAVLTTLAAGELFDFDAFLGYLDAGDSVRLTIGAADDGPAGDRAEIGCRIERAPFIPVSVLPGDLRDPAALRMPGAWSLLGRAAAPAAMPRISATSAPTSTQSTR